MKVDRSLPGDDHLNVDIIISSSGFNLFTKQLFGIRREKTLNDN